MTNEQYYYPPENKLQQMPPWGDGWVADRIKEEYLTAGWQKVDLDFKLPELQKSQETIKADKLQQIDTWTANAITGGFISAAMGTNHTYDSTKEDQQTLAIMLQASQSANFADHPIYHGKIPIRAIPEGETSKVVLQHNAAQMHSVITDMALHIGACKQRGWELQAAVAAANTPEEINSIEW